MKSKIFLISSLSLLLCLSFPCFSQSKKGSLKEAQVHFIESVQYMSKREALSKEINYYKDPQITVARKVSDLTGKDVIHECNLMLQENEEVRKEMESGRRQFGRMWNVSDAKEYALDHPDKIVGAKYYFEGMFTHYNNGYGKRKAYVLCLNGHWYVKEVYN